MRNWIVAGVILGAATACTATNGSPTVVEDDCPGREVMTQVGCQLPGKPVLQYNNNGKLVGEWVDGHLVKR